ncbi:hypothetical protein KUCAC02_025976, partial [Chaenocephalus aceratus]
LSTVRPKQNLGKPHPLLESISPPPPPDPSPTTTMDADTNTEPSDGRAKKTSDSS